MNRRIIGVITAELSDSYQAEVWEGIKAEAETGDESVLCFLGSRINSPDAQETAANTVYEMATPENIDGLIVVTSAISTYAERERVQRLFDAHGSVPKISIGVPVSEAGSVIVDSSKPLKDLIDHLISDHRRRRIAVVAGPRWHVESEQRRRAIERRLAEWNLDLDPSRLVYGDFEPKSGRSATAAILDSGEERPDAIICLNDRMALGTLKELRSRNIGVPEDIAVTGFDGIEETLYAAPPLTTIHQPLRELGRKALMELRSMIAGGPRRSIVLGSQVILRRSCGCFQEADSQTTKTTAYTQAVRRLAERERSGLLRSVGFTLSETFETESLLKRFKEGLAQLGFSDALLALNQNIVSRNACHILIRNGEETDSSGDAPDAMIDSTRLLKELIYSGSRKLWILVPLVFREKALGYMILPGSHPDGEVYEILAMHMASSLEGARLLEHIRRHERSLEKEVARRTGEITETNRILREEVEKRIRLESEVAEISRHTMERIGQDLHDDLCQYLAGIAMHSSVLEDQTQNSGKDIRDSIATINRLLADSIERTKAIARGLMPVGLKESGLAGALGSLADMTQRSSGIPITLTADREWEDGSAELSLEMYRIVQEALYNSVRHSHCSTVGIHLTVNSSPDGRFRRVINVIDDGDGIPANRSTGGMGLKIMQYRAEKSGGDLDIVTGPDGTTVRYALTEAREAP